MEWFKSYEDELSSVFSMCEASITEFPSPLNELGLHYLKKFDVFEKDSAKNYICYLLPFWMRESTRLAPEIYRDISTANIFGMLYYFIQDDLMDTPTDSTNRPTPQDLKSYLALANLLYYEFISIYQQYFPTDSTFWQYFRQYTHEWAEGVLHESRHDYFTANPALVAKKASPVKLGSTALLLLSELPAQIEPANEQMALVLLTLQMMDDWTDWKQDLEDGSYNCLLSLIKSEKQLPRDYSLSVSEVEQAIYVEQIVTKYAEIASATHRQLKAAGIHTPDVLAFHQTLVTELVNDANDIENAKTSLVYGGLNYHLSILRKK
ncbi:MULTISPECIES: class 1 isoprenoid biosynthesis enzyme [Paenibacillus]|uniref:Class 1 isoprenoid biosynthesis enzyme n=1 Tax=Paenibacillus campinasensis TaxID=66347 RepID=A0ABW9T5B5_9BACL|nr:MULTISPECIES: class 1 isoprenoid biosynthesis enzyme [Paenibacillus]MUG67903.1 hypothetical protein [Paenibacillus campinasensis]PAK49706.1 hypothetical protein CHH75_20160 [Paenibacillus sp. 7541]